MEIQFKFGLAARLELPFAVGFASADVVRQITELQHSIFYRQRPLPLPCSFLLDKTGQLIGLYHGPLSVTQLQHDLVWATGEPRARLVAARPLGGQPIATWFAPSPLRIAQTFADAQYFTDAEQVLRDYLSPAASTLDVNDRIRAWQMLARIASEQRHVDDEISALREVARLQPNDTTSIAALARALWSAPETQRHEEADRLLAQLTTGGRVDHSVRVQAAQVWAGAGQASQARRQLDLTLAQQPNHIEALLTLALIQQLSAQPTEAVATYQRVLSLDPNRIDAANNLAWLWATHPDEACRNSTSAVTLAQQFCESTKHQLPELLDTLAASLASAGQFTQADQQVTTAIRLARARGQDALLGRLLQRQALYRREQAFREDAPSP